MRGILVKFVSVLTVLFYLLAVGGFDVHSDHDTGQVYVRLLSAGITCEEIHPDTPCHHQHAEGCEDEENCCSDDILVLSMAGFECSSDGMVPPAAMSFLAVPACSGLNAELPFRNTCPAFFLPGEAPPEPLLHKLCIMRV